MIKKEAMLQPLKETEQGMTAGHMKKSEIVVAVMSRRLGLLPTDKKLHRNLSFALKDRSLLLGEWDGAVDAELAQAIIKHVGSVQGSLSMHEVISDIDIILKRIA